MTYKRKRNIWIAIVTAVAMVGLVFLYQKKHAENQVAMCTKYPLICQEANNK